MRPPSQEQLLNVWERGLQQESIERTLSMLRMAESENPEQFTVGESDRRLLEVRELIFGPEITALAYCPECGNGLELNFDVADVKTAVPVSSAQLMLADGGYEASFRLLTLGDLQGARAAEESRLQRCLLERCLLSVRRGGVAVTADELPEGFIRELSRRMGDADPQAEIRLDLECAECHHQWLGEFDIESFLWDEIQAWASRMLKEVHQLAAAYGWSEQQILALSPLRRHVYLNLVTD